MGPEICDIYYVFMNGFTTSRGCQQTWHPVSQSPNIHSDPNTPLPPPPPPPPPRERTPVSIVNREPSSICKHTTKQTKIYSL